MALYTYCHSCNSFECPCVCPEEPDPTPTQSGTCRHCGEQIVWAEMEGYAGAWFLLPFDELEMHLKWCWPNGLLHMPLATCEGCGRVNPTRVFVFGGGVANPEAWGHHIGGELPDYCGPVFATPSGTEGE